MQDLFFVKEEKPVKSLSSDRADPSFYQGVHVGSLGGYLNTLNTIIFIRNMFKLTGTIVDEINLFLFIIPGPWIGKIYELLLNKFERRIGGYIIMDDFSS